MQRAPHSPAPLSSTHRLTTRASGMRTSPAPTARRPRCRTTSPNGQHACARTGKQRPADDAKCRRGADRTRRPDRSYYRLARREATTAPAPATRTATAPTPTHRAEDPVAAITCARAWEGFLASEADGTSEDPTAAGLAEDEMLVRACTGSEPFEEPGALAVFPPSAEAEGTFGTAGSEGVEAVGAPESAEALGAGAGCSTEGSAATPLPSLGEADADDLGLTVIVVQLVRASRYSFAVR